MKTPPCKEGDIIELISMPYDPDPVPSGSRGTVVMDPVWVQDSWQIVVKWDVERSLSLCVPPDTFRILTEREIAEMAKELP